MVQKIRRIITGHNAAGKAAVLFNDEAPNATPLKGWPGAGVTEIWVTDEMPVSNDGSADRSLRPVRHRPTPSGTIFRVVEIPPETAGTKIDAGATFGQLGSTHQPSAADSAKHPTMHKTDSIDYLVVISGSMHMLMEEGEVELHPGDCIVQRGTNHAWVEKWGRAAPDRPAIACGGATYATYRQWAARSRVLAGNLQALCKPGDRIAIAMTNRPEFLEALFAIWHAGLIAVPMNAKLHSEEFGYIIGNTEASLVLASPDRADAVAAHGRTIAPDSAEWRQLLAGDGIDVVPRRPDDLAWLFYTSGTTG